MLTLMNVTMKLYRCRIVEVAKMITLMMMLNVTLIVSTAYILKDVTPILL